ncbi:type IV pilus modification protein PilV [Agarivorans sp. MS3-6]|uniref:type IV pilus modification protein PilV n=1 Tax=Agarivorans sp. TSD2052 TaxID=2937286 RepID=UPI00200EEB32|nr:type IV pilus modification protein PilV [Agarivorans sp. TSD2052]UPW17759.1 type IV pilus modification protein PilV [Agarivorans sp. TSD2052]
MRNRITPQCRGFTLIEVIVTSFILAIGLLAVVAMQAVAKRSSFETHQRTLAMLAAEDMVERVRLNHLAWQANNPATVTVGDGQAARSKPSCAEDSGVMSNCSLADVVNYDLYHWEYALYAKAAHSKGGLVKPNGCVLLSANGELTVVVTWQSRKSFTGIDSTNTVVSNCQSQSEDRRKMALTTWVAS